MNMVRLGILQDDSAAQRRRSYGLNCWGSYMAEILSHAGIPYEWVQVTSTKSLAVYDMLIETYLDEEVQPYDEVIWQYVAGGGRLISFGGLNKWARRLGCLRSPYLGAGYANVGLSNAQRGEDELLRFIGANPWTVVNADSLTEVSGSIMSYTPDGKEAGDLFLQFTIGEGTIERWAVDVSKTVVSLQQGEEPILGDGVPAADGTGNVDEGILKADDGCTLDWEYDRQSTETGGKYFAKPYGDLWREAVISRLIGSALAMGKTLPFVDIWPDGIDQVLTISHDSDGNLDTQAVAALELLKELGVRSTWCMLEPGYSDEVYRLIKEEGHELAFHYNALDSQRSEHALAGKTWNEPEFDRQLQLLKRSAKLSSVVTNKNHYTRFEGWGELFEWCEKHGIELDQTRGPSKPGNVGFAFGTCHPYFPIAWSQDQNRFYNVLELGFLTQDMDLKGWADSSIITPFLDEVASVRGVAHFLVHQLHIEAQPLVRDSFRQVISEALKRGFVTMTSAEINAWERKRRLAVIQGFGDDGELIIKGAIPEAVICVPFTPANSQVPNDSIVKRYGYDCYKKVGVGMVSV
ncbi:hypothetical protein [Paenibacillus qinlingensis]|uniref:NodB homology domain-containing protein n=1 Tax=Paenibacillus qinlingensis TaxID=1837343 RepID=A0ABU1NNZ5_9BACL|nr:hypothetical protein [Paenibacillus qinlingensis]MDR6549179.1 hypothetical protein [Paenibacillus qinlingensis]